MVQILFWTKRYVKNKQAANRRVLLALALALAIFKLLFIHLSFEHSALFNLIMKIHIVDYGMGNIFSVQKKLLQENVTVSTSSDPQDILQIVS